ncbi:MAG: hypothetical protein GX751_01460 [Desulfuromonadaceae bacterium]|nr:hypothetical protein [Desulfuromonadaceae bacterium]
MEWLPTAGKDFWWLAPLSLLTFLVSLLLVPVLVVRIPRDYFTHQERPATLWRHRHPLVRILFVAVKNFLGVFLLLIGIAMLVLPGQGLLTFVLGVMLVDIKGKYRLERWLVGKRPVLRSINWLRRRGGHPALRVRKIKKGQG